MKYDISLALHRLILIADLKDIILRTAQKNLFRQYQGMKICVFEIF